VVAAVTLVLDFAAGALALQLLLLLLLLRLLLLGGGGGAVFIESSSFLMKLFLLLPFAAAKIPALLCVVALVAAIFEKLGPVITLIE
jgi:hypothetical protein